MAFNYHKHDKLDTASEIDSLIDSRSNSAVK